MQVPLGELDVDEAVNSAVRLSKSTHLFTWQAARVIRGYLSHEGFEETVRGVVDELYPGT